ncbi:MAG: hypothetical protein OHK0029_38470 [Armatimonadaceae bacterium]
MPRALLASVLTALFLALAPGARAQEEPPLPPPVPAPEPPPVGTNLDAPAIPPRDPINPLLLRQQRPTSLLPDVANSVPLVPPEQRGRVILERADQVRSEEIGNQTVYVASGNVRLLYNGYLLTCNRATWSPQTQTLTFSGDVRLTIGEEMILADLVTIERDTNEFLAQEGRTIIPPGRIGQQLIQPVRLSGSTLARVGRNFKATGGFLTTCDFPNPHYKIGFRQADLIPNDRLVLRNAVIYRYDRPVFRLPYLVIPVREGRRFSYLPFIGRTNEEGFFVKVVLGYSLSQTLPGLLRLDLMERKGVGVGFDQAYDFGARSAGTFALYSLQDRNRGVSNLNGRINHQQAIGDWLTTVVSDFQDNSYQSLTADSRTSLTTLTVTRSDAVRNTNISVSYNNSDYSTTQSDNTAYTITQTENLGQRGNVTIRFNGTDSTNRTSFGETVNTSGRAEQSGDIQAKAQLGIFDASLTANRTFLNRQKGTTGGGGAFSGTQRLPDFALSTDSRRLGNVWQRYLPGRFTLGYGRFLESVFGFAGGQQTSRAVTTTRLLFDADVTPGAVDILPRGWLRLTTSGGFRQTYYRSDAAQYVLTGRAQLTQKLNQTANFTFNYSYLRPYGGTPAEFRLDQTGSTNILSSTLSVNSYRTRLSLISGYDIQRAWTDTAPGLRRNPWQNVALQAAFRPNDILETRFTSSYDINTGRLLDLTNRSRIRGENNFALDTGIRYDPRAKRLSQITANATIPVFSRDVTLFAQTGYNGLTRRFDYQQYTLIQSFHDYELVFAFLDQPFGFRRERGFNLSIRLKALPALRPSTGGQFGTPLDTGIGEVF